MRKAKQTTKQPTVKVTVMPLKSKYSDESCGAVVLLRGSGDHAGTVERYTMAAAFACAGKVVLVDTPAAMPRVMHDDSWRNDAEYVTLARVEVECSTDVAAYVTKVKEALDVA